MVVFHLLRCARMTIRGLFATPKQFFDETNVNIYAGWRMVDAFGHVNNSRYLELFELARWHEGGQKRFFQRFRAAEMYPVVAAVHIQFLKEIPPARVVHIRTRTVSCENRSFVVRQHMYDSTGKYLHATALFRLSMVDSRKPSPSSGGSERPLPAGEVKKRKGPSTLLADEAIVRLGYNVAEVREKLTEAWLNDMVYDVQDPTAPSPSSVVSTPSVSSSSEVNEDLPSVREAAVKVLEDVNDLDEKWRGVMRRLQQHLRTNAKANKQEKKKTTTDAK